MQSFKNRNSASKGKHGSHESVEQQRGQSPAVQFVDNRSMTAAQRHLSDTINSSPKQVAQRQQMKVVPGVVQRVGPEEDQLLQGKFEAAQRVEEEELLQGKFETVQRIEEEELLLQGKFSEDAAQRKPGATANNTGLPDNLKSGIENLSGYSMDGVKVHYNSDKPSQLQAHAYAQGTDIHVASGQEKHLPHEAWHVVQQKQGRVKPTFQAKGFAINDSRSLEAEANEMGAKALSNASLESRLPSAQESSLSAQHLGQPLDTTQRLHTGAQVRQFVCGMGSPPSLDDVITKGTKSQPSDIADQISSGSKAFSALRGRADQEVADTFGKGKKVTYNNKPKKGGGTGPAYYKDGETFYDKGAPLPQTVLNVIFETANAAQAGLFQKVESDFDNGSLMDTQLTDYIKNLAELGGLQDDYDSPASKRSLIQEYYEWNSCQIAKASLFDIAPKYLKGGKIASITWESSFGAILECKSFEQYYNLTGKAHRGAVQATLMPKAKTEESGGQVSLDGLF